MKMAELEKKMNKGEIQVELEAMWFAVGAAVFMACFERGLLILSFFQQWRLLVFLTLNLLLLVIFFTSTRPIFSLEDDESNLQEPIGHSEISIECKNYEIEAKEEEIVEEEELSKEDLNERVEAFIEMFRQHLASDGKAKQSRRL